MEKEQVMEELYEHKFILLCGDNINSLGVLRSICEVGMVPIVILLEEGHTKLLENSRYRKHLIISNSFDESLHILLKQYKGEYYKPFIFTTDDNHAELLDCHYDELKDYFYFFNCGRTKSISKYLNKSAICLAAEECGLKIPLGEVVKPGVPPKKLRYPIFTKTIDSVSPGWKRDVFICHTEEEYITVSKMMTSPLLLVQEYIEKVNEVSMQGFSVNGGESVYMPYEKRYLRLTDTSYGGYMFYKKFENEDLKEKIKKLIKKVGFSGCFEIEFLEGKDGGLYFLEVNFRFSASNYGVNYGGVNQPIEWALATIEGKINESKFNLLQQLFVVMNEPKDIRSVRKTGILKWIWQFVTADSWYLYNAKDANPFFAYLYQKVIKKAKKIFK